MFNFYVKGNEIIIEDIGCDGSIDYIKLNADDIKKLEDVISTYNDKIQLKGIKGY